MRKRTVGISVDFDYFVPEDVNLDMQHQESLFYLRTIWDLRGAFLLDALKVSDEEPTFWEKLQPLTKNFNDVVTVSDSHVYALRDPQLITCDTILLFDRHHDCWPITKTQKCLREWYCHTWGRAWLEAGKYRRIVWVTPEGQDPNDYKDSRGGLGHQLRVLPRNKFDPVKFAQRHTLDAVHICRSGCWVPPWLDDRFIKFVRRFNREPGHRERDLRVLQIEADWHPMMPRWDDPAAHIRGLRRLDENFKALREGRRPDPIEGMEDLRNGTE
jgi:hypothetical protein